MSPRLGHARPAQGPAACARAAQAPTAGVENLEVNKTRKVACANSAGS